MKRKLEDKTLALAGIFQACYLVQQIATKGIADHQILTISINTIFQQNPNDTLDVYGGKRHNLQKGLRLIPQQLGHNPQGRNTELTKYAINVLFLAKKLLSDPQRLENIAKAIEKARKQNEHFQSVIHEEIIATLATAYTHNISTLIPRIMVSGDPQLLQISQNTQLIRALLLAAIRSAILWTQLGGSRWQILFQRKKFIQLSQHLLRV